MEAWNVYASTLLSANLQLPLSSWMSYDIRFRTLAASNPALCWDIRHTDLWLECLTISRTSTSARWPCPHCNSLYHFPDRYPFRSSRPSVPTPDNRQPSSLGTSANPNSPNSTPNNQTHQPTIVEISTTGEGAHDRIVPSATCVSAVEVPIQDSSVPTPQDSHFPDLDDGGPRTPLRLLILEWELRNHHDKTFVEQLLSDI